ncbi:MAG: NUDIX hydrolase [Deltaproteobacteria bacterium]|nr:NUDIX hydrolase [Deltaproteobacteria bacterium]
MPSKARNNSRGKPLKTEKQVSSGGVIFRRSNGSIEVALIEVQASKGMVWCLPKGLKEEGENLARTAHREVKEETGLDGKILKKIGDIHYFYAHREKEGTKRFFKIVYFFLMEYTSGDTVYHDEEVLDCRWFPIDEAINAASYKDEKEILKKAVELLEKEEGD